MKRHLSTILLVAVFLTGVCILLYPTVSDYWNSLHQSRAIGTYEDTLSTMTQQDYSAFFEQADGINALAGHIDVLERAEHPVVLTPHRAEFARICDESPELPPAEMAAAFAQRHRCVLLLKGHRTLIAAPDGRVYRNTTGNPGMAKGGSGDVLSGVILSLLGQGIPPVEAAVCGAYLHGRAGDFAANEIGEYGMTPSDMLAYLPRVLKPLNSRVW